MTPIKIIIEVDEMGVSAMLYVGDIKKDHRFKDQPVTPVEVAFMVRQLVEKHL